MMQKGNFSKVKCASMTMTKSRDWFGEALYSEFHRR